MTFTILFMSFLVAIWELFHSSCGSDWSKNRQYVLLYFLPKKYLGQSELHVDLKDLSCLIHSPSPYQAVVSTHSRAMGTGARNQQHLQHLGCLPAHLPPLLPSSFFFIVTRTATIPHLQDSNTAHCHWDKPQYLTMAHGARGLGTCYFPSFMDFSLISSMEVTQDTAQMSPYRHISGGLSQNKTARAHLPPFSWLSIW